MKAVLGMLLILVGFTVGWLTLTGKLPPTGDTLQTVPGVTPETQAPSSAPNKKKSTPPLQQLGSTQRITGTPKQ